MLNVSAALKIDANDGRGAYIYLISGDVYMPAAQVGAKVLEVNDIVVASLLSPFFTTIKKQTKLENTYPYVTSITTSNAQEWVSLDQFAKIGTITSSYTNPSHGNTVSLSCFSEQNLRDFIVEGFVVSDELQLAQAVQNAPMAALGGLIEDAVRLTSGGGREAIVEITKDPKLTISRCTAAEIVDAQNAYWDHTTPYFDAFDMVKERLTRQESYLNGIGRKPAIYTNNGGNGSNDTIVFSSEYGISIQMLSLT